MSYILSKGKLTKEESIESTLVEVKILKPKEKITINEMTKRLQEIFNKHIAAAFGKTISAVNKFNQSLPKLTIGERK